jgi:hypothetical protein
MPKLGTIVRTQVRTRFGPSNAYTVTLPGHWETDGSGARVLVDGGTHEATSTGTRTTKARSLPSSSALQSSKTFPYRAEIARSTLTARAIAQTRRRRIHAR